MKKQIFVRAAVLLLPFFAVAAVLLFTPLLLKIGEGMPPCVFRSMTALYCPGCGNTRSVMALLNGDVLNSLRLNPLPVLVVLGMGVWYVELLLRAFGRKVKLIPRSWVFWVTLTLLFLIYAAVRTFVPFLRPV